MRTTITKRGWQLISSIAKLKSSQYGNDEDLSTMMDSFERSTKPTFKDPADRSFIKFGSIRDRDPAVGIRSGQLSLEGCVRVSNTQLVSFSLIYSGPR